MAWRASNNLNIPGIACALLCDRACTYKQGCCCCCCWQINWRLEDDPITANTAPEHQDAAFRASCRTKIYLGYTSNLISAGVREQIRCAKP
jgi:hypothetical protein